MCIIIIITVIYSDVFMCTCMYVYMHICMSVYMYYYYFINSPLTIHSLVTILLTTHTQPSLIWQTSANPHTTRTHTSTNTNHESVTWLTYNTKLAHTNNSAYFTRPAVRQQWARSEIIQLNSKLFWSWPKELVCQGTTLHLVRTFFTSCLAVISTSLQIPFSPHS